MEAIESGRSATWWPWSQSNATRRSVASWKVSVAGATRNATLPSVPQTHSTMWSMSRTRSLVQSPRSGSPGSSRNP
ncbi:MAG TPA: hypothetical protein VGB90_09050 [Alphaproteobacteria bacterium]